MSATGETLKQRIHRLLAETGRSMDDDEIAAALGARRQAVNMECRILENEGLIVRGALAGSKIQNRLQGSLAPPQPQASPAVSPPSGLLSEDEVKTAVRDHLQARGYKVIVAWGRERGIDIDASKPADRVIIEAKGEVARGPQQVNYFLGALGELVQRMAYPDARYGLALPDNPQYRGLVGRLPAHARKSLKLVVFFISREDVGYRVVEE